MEQNVIEQQITDAPDMLALEKAQAWLSVERLNLAKANTDMTMYQLVVLSLAPNYMKPSTATLPASRLTDAQSDAAFLKIAADEVMKLLA